MTYDTRHTTRTVKIGSLKIGGANPVRIKGMLKTPGGNISGLIKEARRLEQEGAEAIRVAVKERPDVKLAPVLKKYLKVPLVADVHFHAGLVLSAIEAGFDAIRLNPANISSSREVRQIARSARDKGVAIRVGINSGGFKKKFSSPQKLAQYMAKTVADYLKTLEDENFFDIMVSLKGSDVPVTIIANEIFSQKSDYPLHLGITATGPFMEGAVKSAVGIGSLLYKGLGDVIRVSLTGPSFWEIRVAKHILQALNLRNFGPRIISCPTCSRCEVNLIKIVDRLNKELDSLKLKQPLKIAVMGCVVNGPGEAYQADIGVAFGKTKAVIFRKNNILGYTTAEKTVKDLMRYLS